MILIGQNNHGKSNIISALLFFFGEINLDPLDFNIGSDELSVEIVFDNLENHDKRTFKKYVTGLDTIKVIKQASKTGGSYYHGYLETPTEAWLLEEKISNFTKREVAEGLPLNEFLPESGRITKDLFRQAQEKYIEANRENLTFSYRKESGPFLGAKNVAKGIFGEVYFVPAIKKAEDDFSPKGRSVFGSLYSRVINKMSETNPQFIEAKEKISTLMRILNKEKEDGTENESRPTELTSLETALQSELSSWDTKIDVEITPPNIDDFFKVGATVWVDDGIRTDVARKGHGLQRSLIFALVRALAKLTREEQASAAEDENGQGARSASRSSYFIIEEPELFLHPQAQRELFASLYDLSQADSQVFLCTHSSSFMSLDHYRSICIVRKNNLDEGTTVLQCTEDLFSDAERL